MILDDLLQLARDTLTCGTAEPRAEKLSRVILDLLGELPPCGWPDLERTADGMLRWPVLNPEMTDAEARAVAGMMIRKADR